MQAKLCIVLPKIKSERVEGRSGEMRPISRTPIPERVEPKKVTVMQSVNNFRLASLTPEARDMQKLNGNMYNSPKLKDLLSEQSMDGRTRSKSRLRKEIMRIRRRKKEGDKEAMEIQIPARYYAINIKEMLKEGRKESAERGFEFKSKLYRLKYEISKSMIQYYKF
jgi:hypothetical protein